MHASASAKITGPARSASSMCVSSSERFGFSTDFVRPQISWKSMPSSASDRRDGTSGGGGAASGQYTVQARG